MSDVRYTPDGNTLLTAGNDGTIRQWDATSGREVRVMSDALVCARSGHLTGRKLARLDLPSRRRKGRAPELSGPGGIFMRLAVRRGA